MIFISDRDNGVTEGDLAGTLITADGVRYRFDGSALPGTDPYKTPSIDQAAYCSLITDRNGNIITFTSDQANGDLIITDPLGRQTRVGRFSLDISYVDIPGHDGTRQRYTIKSGVMNQNYRAGINPVLPVINGDRAVGFPGCGFQGPHTSLFPNSFCRQTQIIDGRQVITELVLPDSRSIKFAYNEYGEVAEITLPTGGKIQYDYATALNLPSGNSSPEETAPTPQAALGTHVQEIDRAVVARRVYPNGDTSGAPESIWSYAYNATIGVLTIGGSSWGARNGVTEVKATTPGGALLLWQKHYFLDGGRYSSSIDGTGYTLWSTGLERRSETLDALGNVISATEWDWAQRAPVSWGEQPENDNRVTQVRNYLDNGGFSRVETFYDDVNNPRANNVIEVREYDFDQTLTRRTVTSYLTTNPDNGNVNYSADDIFLLRLPASQSIFEGDVERARTVYQYDKYADDGNNATLTDYGPSVTGHDAAYGAGSTTRGNVTAVGRWLDTNGSTLFTYSRYDTLGNVVSTKDPRGNVATVSYADNFGAGDNPDGGAGGAFGPTFALPTLITGPPPNPGGQQLTVKYQYDFNTGLVTALKDHNGVITKTEYNDPFNRQTKVISAKGVTGVEAQTVVYYAPQSTPYGVTLARNDVLTAKDRDAVGDGILRSWTVTDGFGRTIESWTRHPQGDAKVATNYDGLGRVSRASNPHRNGETPAYTTTTYDLAGRVTTVVTPDGAHIDTAYSGNQVTGADQAGKRRRSETDALGRLIRVIEDPDNLNYVTFYSYDALGNLRQVIQGSQTRTFAYDSLSRLTSATNPESGTVTYAYDLNGNVIEKTDARGVRTTMAYDALNRVRSKVYAGLTPEGTAAANATPQVNYFYDDCSGLPSGAPCFPGTPSKGRLTGVAYGPGSEGTYYKYNAAGKIVTNHQRQGTANYVTAYFYNRAGAVTREDRGGSSLTRRRNWMYYDEAGRPLSMQSGAYNGFGIEPHDLVNDISYTPFGGLQSEIYGNGLIHSMAYNERLQPIEIRLGRSDNLESVFRIGYIFGTAHNVNGQDPEITLAHNNGNVARIKYFVSGALQYSQTFQYDPLNRLSYAVEHNNGVYNDGARAWYQSFAYDPHGNRGINVANTSDNVNAANRALQLADFSEANNRITRAGFAYDAAGNLIAEPQKLYTYDAEGRLVTATVAGVGTSQYFYDGNGRRVKKIAPGVATRFEYGAGDELITERNDSNSVVIKDYFYNGGELIATTKTGTNGEYQYATADHLGTPRAWTNDAGALIAGGRHDYLPFGEELFAGYGVRTTDQGYASNTQQDGQRNQFTGKERDNETELDFFGARYYGSAQGRFLSPDPLEPWMLDKQKQLAFYSNPQKWNKYVYVLNNPLRYVDPTGLADIPAWGSLKADLRKDLEKRGVTKDIWNGWDNEQRQTTLNARALLISIGVWDHVTSLAFSKFEFKERVTIDVRGNPRHNRVLSFEIDNKSGWRIAITTDTDTEALLSHNSQLRSEWAIWNHPEGRWTYKQKGDDIVVHLVGIMPPWDKYTQFHTDSGGGSIFNSEHRNEVSSGTGSGQDRVSEYLGKNPSTRKLLQGISRSLDKVLGPNK
jgi:RHS repeat-associated protein